MDVLFEDRLRNFADVLPGVLVRLPSSDAPRFGLRLVAHELGSPGAPGFVNFLALSTASDFAPGQLRFVEPRTRVVEIPRAAVVPILDSGVCLDPAALAMTGDIEIAGPEVAMRAAVFRHDALLCRVDLHSGQVTPLAGEDGGALPAVVRQWSLRRGTVAVSGTGRECLFER